MSKGWALSYFSLIPFLFDISHSSMNYKTEYENVLPWPFQLHRRCLLWGVGVYRYRLSISNLRHWRPEVSYFELFLILEYLHICKNGTQTLTQNKLVFDMHSDSVNGILSVTCHLKSSLEMQQPSSVSRKLQLWTFALETLSQYLCPSPGLSLTSARSHFFPKRFCD